MAFTLPPAATPLALKHATARKRELMSEKVVKRASCRLSPALTSVSSQVSRSMQEDEDDDDDSEDDIDKMFADF
jgi:hypothetical protein